MDASQDIYRAETPPPRYPGGDVDACMQLNQSCPPSFEEVMALYAYEDTIRLPTYQTRSLRRYHPYWQVRPVGVVYDGITRYYNTIFDESYEALEVPALNPPAPISHDVTELEVDTQENLDRLDTRIPPVPVGPPPVPPAPVVGEPDEDLEERHRLRIRRLWHLIPEFMAIVLRPSEVTSLATERAPIDTPSAVGAAQDTDLALILALAAAVDPPVMVHVASSNPSDL